MARTVLTNDMVAHVWAQQEQEHGRSSNGNFYFRGPTIYSYRDGYPIGHFVDCPDGEKAVLLWSGSYSVTTSGHQRMAESAVRHVRKFSVPDLLTGNYGDLEERAAKNAEELNDKLKGFIAEVLKSAGNANMTSRLYMIEYGYIRNAAEATRDYCKAFRLKCPEPARSYTDEALRAQHDAIIHQARAKAEAKRARRLARFDGDREAMAAADARHDLLSRATRAKLPPAYRWVSYRFRERLDSLAADLAAAHDANPADETIARHHQRFVDWRAMQVAHQQAEQERLERYRLEREQQEALTAERKAAFETMGPLQQRDACIAGEAHWQWLAEDARVDAWREGLAPRHALPYAHTAHTAKLRVRGETVETSQGASFPVAHARRAWRVLRVLYQRGEAWQSNGHSIKLGHFAITRVAADGTVTAGCHTVVRSEVERLAVALGLPPVSDLPAGVQEAIDWTSVET